MGVASLGLSLVPLTLDSPSCFSSSPPPFHSSRCTSSSSSTATVLCSGPFSYNRSSIDAKSRVFPSVISRSRGLPYLYLTVSSFPVFSKRQVCRAASEDDDETDDTDVSDEDFDVDAVNEYKFPDPIPEFAEAETEKFKTHLLKSLSKREDIFGDSVEEIVEICTEILGTFFHAEYGGPGTLLVNPFMDMAETINKKGLPGGPQAARAAVKWAQNHVDKDWNQWTGADSDQ
ncbi:uncharacterized protein LOC131145237 [Malania oleifera]|uniref:uncharacterized protein LOC131145237 n=1 Tax=Malania oleifera TaxID=397392 RepID=UPI0025AE13F7|nr:uncharacterized protein LOC131145237 [Malania oleifera]